jgi:hypothetical protein
MHDEVGLGWLQHQYDIMNAITWNSSIPSRKTLDLRDDSHIEPA